MARKLNIVITDTPYGDTEVEEKLFAPLDASITVGRCRSEEDVLAIAHDADALIVQWAPITRRVIEQLTRCRIISRYGVGIDMIDSSAARELGITVANVPDYCVEEVATHTLCFVLGLSRKVFLLGRQMRQGNWPTGDSIRPVRRLRNQTLGLVGVGRIGRRVAELVAPLGMRILGHDIVPSQDPIVFTDFETVVRESDFLSLHCPLTEATRHLMNEQVFTRMKPTSFLINASRGAVVDTSALLDAVSSGKIAGAALDVFEQEPLPADHPLRKLDNVILTPHMAAYSTEARAQLREDAARHVLEFFQRECREMSSGRSA